MIATALKGSTKAYRHIAVESCISTNVLCFEQAIKGEPGNLWITSAEQTGGKASRGRSWVSKPGNLYSSLLLENPCAPEHFSELTFVAALAVREAIEDFLPHASLALKWPNDVLVNEKKCSGILLESRQSTLNNHVVIGIGINCGHHPADTSFPATDLLSEGIDLEPPAVFEVLARKIASFLQIWDAGNEFDMIRENWLNHAWGLGKTTRVGLYDGSVLSGTFKGLDESGHMLLIEASGHETSITVGDIFALPMSDVRDKDAGEMD